MMVAIYFLRSLDIGAFYGDGDGVDVALDLLLRNLED